MKLGDIWSWALAAAGHSKSACFLPHFTVLESYARYCPEGAVTLEEARTLLKEAVTCAAASGIFKILLDTRRLTGFRIPNTMDRFALGEELAQASGGKVAIALVTKAIYIDPQYFGVTVARNRGAHAEVFEHELEAVEWLVRLEKNR